MNAIPERLSTALEGRYRIEREIGAGGMATVYLAQDLKHDRKVALKVLKPELAAVLGAERFVVEIKTTASLSHPHILPLFDSGTADGFLFYVMPFVEGETLRDRLNRETQLGIEESVKIATEVADALDYAHRHGVIHRDIKPENILMHDGRPMVADFGIALALSAAAGGRMTETGLSLGTPHYMSPEQATAAKEITARSDVYSLGSVLYEMLTGAPPHVGASAQQIIMKIVTEEAAPVTNTRKAVPANVADAVARSLEKLPADRFESAKAFAEALASTAFSYARASSAAGASTRGLRAAGEEGPSRWDRRSRVLGGFAVLLGAVTLWLGLARVAGDAEDSPAPVVAFRMIDSVPGALSLALAIDGTIAFVRDSTILVRLRGEVTETAIAGAEGALSDNVLVFSPDGGQLGYAVRTGTGSASRTTLRRIAIRGGTASTLWTALPGEFATPLHWSEDGWLYLLHGGAGSFRFSLARVPETGGEIEELLAVPSGFVNDARTLPGSSELVACLVALPSEASRVITLDLASRDTVTIAEDACSPRWSPTGHLLVATRDGAVNAIPFDPRRMLATGAPVRVIDNVATSNGVARYELSAGGTLIFVAGPPTNVGNVAGLQLAFVNLAGGRDQIPLPPTDHPDARLSPDGRQLAYTRNDQVWLYDLDLGTHLQLTATGTGHHNPIWSPDGKRIAYRSLRAEGQGGDVYVQTVSGDSTAVHVGGTPGGDNPAQWLADGTILTYSDAVRADVTALAADQPGKVTPILRADWNERHPIVSPDGRWLAYLSEEGGRSRVTLRSWPALGKKSVISDGTVAISQPPLWSRDSRTLYYQQRAQIVAASLGGADSLRVLSRRVVADSVVGQLRDIHPDGRRLLVFLNQAQADVAAARTPRQLIVVTNWLTALRERLGASGGR